MIFPTRRPGGLLTAVAAVFLLAAASVQARVSTATVRVRLVVPSGLAAERTTVQIQAVDDQKRLASQALSGSGVVAFNGLPAALYRVTVDQPGAAAGSLDLRADSDEIVTIEAIVALAGAGPTVLTIVDRHRDGQGTDFRAAQLRNLPGNDSVWSLIGTSAPFLITDRVDAAGLGVTQSGLAGSRGASWRSTTMTFGEIEVRNADPNGTLPLAPDLNAVEAIAISSGMAPVDVSTGGVAIALVPRRAGATPHGGLQVSFAGPRTVSLNARSGAPSISRLDSWKHLGVQYGGPFGSNLRAFTSAATTHTRHEDRDRPIALEARVSSLFTHVVAQPTLRDEVRVIANVQNLERPFDGRAQFRDRDVSEGATFAQFQTTWERQSARGIRGMASLSYQRSSVTPEILSPPGGTVDRFGDGPMPTPAVASTFGRWEMRLEIDPPSVNRLGISHSLRFGTTIGRSSGASRVLASPTVAELVYGVPARVWVNTPSTAESARTATDLAAYVSDHIALSGNLSVSAGLRIDLGTGSAAGADNGISWQSLAPRLSFRWAPKHVAVFGGYSRYYPRLSLDLLTYGDPAEPWGQVYRWADRNGNREFESGELGPLVARFGRNRDLATIDSHLRPPHTDEFALGAERRFGHSMLRGTAVIRREHALLGSANVGVPLSSYRTLYVPDQGEDYDSDEDDRPLAIYDRLPSSFGLDRFLLTNPDGQIGRYKGFELEWLYTGSRLHMLIGAMAYHTHGTAGNRGFKVDENDQGIVGEHYEGPNAASYSFGSGFFDRSYVLKWSTSYDAPHDIRLGVVGRYQDGQPFSRQVLARDLAQGPELVPAYRTGRTRFTFLATLDARVEKGLRLGRRRAAVTLEVFNLTNRSNEIEEDTVTGPNFRMTTAVEPPRALRLGFRIAF